MQHYYTVRTGVLALAALALVSCGETNTLVGTSFNTQYFAARDALETGKFEKASRSYARLLTRAGPLEPRIRLEYSHALLRAGDNAAAAREARTLAHRQNGLARHAALSVAATAEHELGIDAIQSGDQVKGKQLLKQADAAITEVLKNDPGLDPLGALAGRQASIRVRLKALG